MVKYTSSSQEDLECVEEDQSRVKKGTTSHPVSKISQIQQLRAKQNPTPKSRKRTAAQAACTSDPAETTTVPKYGPVAQEKHPEIEKAH